MGAGTFYTITREFNGAPNGPHYIVRRHGRHYVGWGVTRAAARTIVKELGGRVVR